MISSLTAAAILFTGIGTASAYTVNPATNLGLSINQGSNYVANFNPFSPNQRGGNYFTFEPLLIINMLSGNVTPWLATKYGWSNNGKTLTFTIRKGVKWSDGKSLTPADVAFTYTLLKKFPAMDTNGLWSNLTNVTVHGDQVVMNMKEHNSFTFSTLSQTPIVPQHIWSKVKNPASWANPNPVVTGPYILASLNPNEYVLKRNPYYWQKKLPFPQTLTVPALPSNQGAQMALDQQTLDWAGLFIPKIENGYVRFDTQHNKYWYPPSTPTDLFLNLTKYPFNITAFRHALAYALNRTGIGSKGESGYAAPASPTEIVLPFNKMYLDTAVAKKYAYAYNPTKAKAILKAAGFKWNAKGSLIDPKGKPVSFKLEVPNGWTDWVEDCQVIGEELAQIGITVHLYTPSSNTFTNELGTGSFDAALWNNSGGSDPGLLFFQDFASVNTAPIGQQAGSNYERWKNKTTDKLINEYSVTSNSAKRKMLLNQLQAQVAEQLPVIPIFYQPMWAEYKTNKYVGWPTPSNPYAAPATFYYPESLYVVTHLRPAH